MRISDLLKDNNNIIKVFEKALIEKNKKIASALLSNIKEPRLLYRYFVTFRKRLPPKIESFLLQEPLFGHLYVKELENLKK